MPGLCNAKNTSDGIVIFDVAEREVAPGSLFPVIIRLSTKKAANALNVEIGYSPSVFEIEQIETGLSLINIWKESVDNSAPGVIKITGGRAPAFLGERGELLRFYVRAKRPGIGSFSFRKADIYQSDGLGTLLDIEKEIKGIAVSSRAKLINIVPEMKQPELSPSSNNLKQIRDPVTEKIVLIQAEPDGTHHAPRTVLISTKRWFFWSDWMESDYPVSVESGVWLMQLRLTHADGSSSESTHFFLGAAFRKILIVLSVVAVLAVLYIRHIKAEVYNENEFEKTTGTT